MWSTFRRNDKYGENENGHNRKRSEESRKETERNKLINMIFRERAREQRGETKINTHVLRQCAGKCERKVG